MACLRTPLEAHAGGDHGHGYAWPKTAFLVQSALLGWLGVDAAKALWRYGTMELWHYGNKV